MIKTDLVVGNYYYYQWFEMEFIWHYGYNYLFRVKFIDDRIIQEIGSIDQVYTNKKEMMMAMYGKEIQPLIDKQNASIAEWKDMDTKIKDKIQKIAKDMWTWLVLSQLLAPTIGVDVANALSLRLQKEVQKYLDWLK